MMFGVAVYPHQILDGMLILAIVVAVGIWRFEHHARKLHSHLQERDHG